MSEWVARPTETPQAGPIGGRHDGASAGSHTSEGPIHSEETIGMQSARRVYDLSAELRTPLASIAGYVELLIEEQLGPLNEDQRHALQITHRNALRLAELVNALLDERRG
jgi:signal transduction histidine kinase